MAKNAGYMKAYRAKTSAANVAKDAGSITARAQEGYIVPGFARDQYAKDANKIADLDDVLKTANKMINERKKADPSYRQSANGARAYEAASKEQSEMFRTTKAGKDYMSKQEHRGVTESDGKYYDRDGKRVTKAAVKGVEHYDKVQQVRNAIKRDKNRSVTAEIERLARKML